MSRMQTGIAQDGYASDTKPARLSFNCRIKSVGLALPRDLDTGARLLLVYLMAHADDAGAGIYVGTEMLCGETGMSRRAVFRHMGTLASRGYVQADGWKTHASGARTRRRRLHLPAPAAAPAPRPELARSADPDTRHSADPVTVPVTRSADPGTRQSADLVTQANGVNQERFEAILAWQAGDNLAPSEMLELLWKHGGWQLISLLTGKPEKRARGLLAELVALGTRRHPERVIDALKGAVLHDQPARAEAEAYLIAACKPDGWLSHTGRISRDWHLPSFGDPVREHDAPGQRH